MRGCVLVTIGVVLHLACGGKAMGPPLSATTLGVTAENACRESAKALCKRALECSKPVVDFFFGSFCEEDVYSACAARYEGPGASKTPASCASGAPAIPCEAITDMAMHIDEWATSLLLRHCPVTPGAFAENDACISDGDCQSTFCARDQHNQACGHCRNAPLEQEPCDGDRKCAVPLRCAGASRRCERPRLYGEPCGSSCANGWCAPDGHCEKPVGLGEKCGDGVAGCDLGHGFVCNMVRGVCESLSIVGLNQDCDALDLPLKPGMRLCTAGLSRNTCVQGKCYTTSRVTGANWVVDVDLDGCWTQEDCKKGTCVNGHCRVACLP